MICCPTIPPGSRLDDSNSVGTFRSAINTAPGTGRTIVFDIADRIDLLIPLRLMQPFVTIAGQSAPGDGITISGYEFAVLNTRDGEGADEWRWAPRWSGPADARMRSPM